MALVYDARNSTYDIDALYKPKDVLTDVIAEIAKEHGLSSQWLNDDVYLYGTAYLCHTGSTPASLFFLNCFATSCPFSALRFAKWVVVVPIDTTWP